MNRNVILVAETGSDLTPQMATKIGAYLVPMHVSMGGETYDDGAFPPEDVCAYYDRTGKVPQTSAANPGDFAPVFDEIHAKYPEGKILHLAYSAVTTCSYQSAVIAAEDRDYISMIDTRQVSVGQAAVVVEMAKYLQSNPDVTLDEAIAVANDLISRANMCFLPDNLEFLRAGGRVSNAVALGSRILSLHPTIEILNGKLTATKKYRGKMEKVAAQLICDYSETYNLDRSAPLWVIYTVGLAESVKQAVNQTASECGFKEVEWVLAHGVITTHGGPAAIGIAGFSKA
jgi:DegV family protein with EDD domain